MRRIIAAAGALSLTVLALTACATTSSGSASCVRDVSGSSALDLVDVSDTAVGTKPTVSLTAPVNVSDLAVADTVSGDGRAITSDAQDVVFDLTVLDGSSGTPIAASGYTGTLSEIYPLDSWEATFPGLVDGLQCATEGSRVVMALGPDEVTADTRARFGMAEDATTVVVLDLQKVYPAAADGAEQFNDRMGMPSVVLAPDGRPGIVVPDSTPPADLAVEVLKKGDGPEVTGDVPVRVHYTGVTWDDHQVFDTTWDRGAQPVELDSMIPGFADALRGQTVGSQILVVVPPDQGYGDTAQAGIPAGSTLVFVVDVLGLDPAS
ncbi:FKBP-type peptidyl-prolyl cis-trans isomerase [Microbacterium sp. cf332]|uniref:FKBP-type peptidyl-prolyl cis-trans isomerase n=1 Tax=Microbacterium sp. cf332 TaxID=1761804 RepID=UPI00088E8452|nr:FKBP-type peptidyl-prolyl cis-trans isomerase [Microbacterium sp. cf332]SDQ08257.1 peptidylprolyl isomerase [Microbacterium sp. cf332]